MPGFIIHLAESEMILPNLYTSKKEQNEFLLGALLPDTKATGYKQESHFWKPEDLAYLARAPHPDLFLDRYGKWLDEPVVMGYYAHLCLDESFVKKFWPKMIRFFNEDDVEEVGFHEVKKVFILKNQEIIARDRFFSEEYYYGDYSRMNEHFLNAHAIRVPEYEETLSVPIQEVDYPDVKDVLLKLKQLKESSKQNAKEELKVFAIDQLERFLLEEAELFLQKIR